MVVDSPLDASRVLPALKTNWLGRNYHYLAETDSTNQLLAEMARQGWAEDPPAGTVVLTDYQRRGRGRFARRWEAPPRSSLLLSILLRPDWPAVQMSWLGMIVSIAAVETITEILGLRMGIKWPNDLVVHQDGGWHKVSGLLVQNVVGEDGRLSHAIVGIGVNVNIAAVDLPPAPTPPSSLQIALGSREPLPRLPLLVELLARVESGYRAAEAGKSPQPAWQKWLVTLGEVVQVTHTQTGAKVVGLALQTDPWGHLLVQDERGELHTIMAGEVTLRPF